MDPSEALEKRRQLVQEGYCVVPGVLRGALLQELQAHCERFFQTEHADPRFRYQGSDFHIQSEARFEARGRSLDDLPPHLRFHSPLVDRLLALPAMQEALEQIGFGGGRSDGAMLLLSKPPFGPPLYWHQDLMTWNDPIAAAPWPTRIFLSFYMVDTTRESGCLRVIPGTHRKRIPLHDVLPPAHGPELQQAGLDHPAFQDYPDAVDLPVKVGDLAINDARVLHAAHANNTARRRTLVLFWHSLSPDPPSWWTGEIPEVVRRRDPSATYELTRIPGEHLPR